MSGSPARTNAPSCRERCMTTSRFTRGSVTSSFSRLFFSVTRMSRSCRSYSVSAAASALMAFCTPVVRRPCGSVAT